MKLKQLKTIDIEGKKWFDKLNGNSYFSARVILNFGMPNSETIKIPFQYGYGSQYEYVGIHAVRDMFPRSKWAKEQLSEWQMRQHYGIIVRKNMQEGCLQRDCKEWGGE